MVLKVYSVFDSKGGSWSRPTFLRSRGEALRSWMEVVNDPQSPICKYPSDFTLFEVADFNELDGSFKSYETKVSLGLAVQFKNRPESSAPLLDLIEKGN